MFALAILTGIYSYVIFGLGILGILHKELILFVTIIFLASVYFYFKKRPEDFPRINLKNKKVRPFLILFLILSAINLIGALGPELAFDSLWYHLTLPKIFLENRSIDFIPGGLFYYSLMPKLGEMLYISGLIFGSEILPKLMHFSFGILNSVVVYKISRKFLDEKYSIIASLIFYGSLVVAFESTTAYIDLIRTFFEGMALWGVINWFETKDRKWLIESGTMLGLAISTKLLALGSLPVFVLLFFFFESDRKAIVKKLGIFVGMSLLVSFPWFFFAFLTTGNPFYPIFSDFYKAATSLNLFNPLAIVKDIFVLFLKADDPISPIYAIIFPLIFVLFRKLNKEQKIIAVYSLLALIVWCFTPRTGGGRFILPYLPAFSVLSIILISNIKELSLKKYMLILVVLIFVGTLFYRGLANSKYLPVIFRMQTEDDFLKKNLNFNYGDFYDTDNFFRGNIKKTDRVLLYGFHNLYYADFPFIHESYAKAGDKFNFIATQNAKLPERFSHWDLIYENKLTKVKVYTLGETKWSY